MGAHGKPAKETARAAAAYEAYAAMGPMRSLRALAKHLSATWGGTEAAKLMTLGAWSSAHGWQERVKAYDAERAEERARRREAEREAMDDRQARAARRVFSRMSKRLRELADAGDIGGQAAAVAWKHAADIERTARGAPTQQVEVSGKVDVSDARDLLAARLAALVERSAAAPTPREPDA